MKPFLSLLLIAILLFGCSYHPSTTAAGTIGNKVKVCCTSLASAKDDKIPCSASREEKSEPVSVFERSGQILTW